MSDQVAPSAPPAQEVAGWSNVMQINFDSLCIQLNLNAEMRNRALRLRGKQIVVIADDSGSMQKPLRKSFLSGTPTRWDELRVFMQYVVRLGAVMCNGVIVKFLNRVSPDLPILTPDELNRHFMMPPYGRTPLLGAMRHVFTHFAPAVTGRDLVLVIATDGEPSDGTKRDVYNLLRTRPDSGRVFVNFLVCTDNNDEVAYLNEIDKRVQGIDVSDDYRTECKQVKKCNPWAQFSVGDWVVKAVVGAADPHLDGLDELRHGVTWGV